MFVLSFSQRKTVRLGCFQGPENEMAKRKQQPVMGLGGVLQSLEIHRQAFLNLRMLETKVEIALRSGKDAAFIVQIVKEEFAEYDAAMKPQVAEL
jgi:hypothetical protein